jgi:hypothetical protein
MALAFPYLLARNEYHDTWREVKATVGDTGGTVT